MKFLSASIALMLLLLFTACNNESVVNLPEPIVDKSESKENTQNLEYDVEHIQIPYSRYSQPCATDERIYIPFNSQKERLQNSILEYDLQKKESVTIYKSELKNGTINDLTCNNEWMVWAETDEFGLKGSVHAWNRTNDKKSIVFKYDDQEKMALDAPRLYQNMIAWITTTNNKSEVVLYDLDSKKHKVLATLELGSFYNNSVDFNEGNILWTDTVNSKGKYYVYNLATGDTKEFVSSSPYVGYAKLLNDNIISINFEDINTWSSGKFGTYNIKTKDFNVIEKDYISQFDSYGNHTAYITKDHELVYYDTSSNKKINLMVSINHKVDTVDFTNEGYLIAGYRNEDSSELFLIKFE
ncbi:WD40 repeat domain-containing protein [Paenibacillus pini]|uniref:Lipoprotein n=1 Tax=Paenibacillus pini JCM 16418 TaxID=1236976 RepID=W7YBR7_9BACL|nr:WD40 repeat domain-containing protein [Paenibacillus pini]GAF08295.1 hypothetical protein JCM16418_2363 [Paenibacillus pini JCM 16418]